MQKAQRLSIDKNIWEPKLSPVAIKPPIAHCHGLVYDLKPI